MAELIEKKMLSGVAVPLTKAQTVNGRVYVDFQCLFERIDELPTTTESEIRAKAIDEFAEKMKELINKWIEKGVITMGSIDEIAEQLKGE